MPSDGRAICYCDGKILFRNEIGSYCNLLKDFSFCGAAAQCGLWPPNSRGF